VQQVEQYAAVELYRALHQIAVAVGGVYDTADLARIVTDGAISLLGADAGDVYLWDSADRVLRPLFSSDALTGWADAVICAGQGASGRAWESGAPTHVPDYANWEYASPFGKTRNVRAALAVPLRVADQTTGVLALRFYQPHTCSPEQIEMLGLLAAQVAPALEAARLYTLAQRQIEERKLAETALRTSEERFRRQYEGNPIPTFSWRFVDGDFVLEDYNNAATALTLNEAPGWVGRRASELYADHPHIFAEFLQCATEQRTIRRDLPFSPISTSRDIELNLTYVFVPPDIVMVHSEDVTERNRAEATLRRQTLHDDLTGLPNRLLLNDRLQHAISAARRDDAPFALLLVDLDRFKDVNDTLGHHAGDALLRMIGPRFQRALRSDDILARLGGDEFAILLFGADEPTARTVALRLLKTLDEPFELNGASLDIGGSVGMALYPQHGDDAEVFLQRADVAMYVAKRAGGGLAAYSPEHDHHSPERLAFQSELRHGIERGELILFYQPKFACLDGQLVGVEVLVRWRHPRRGLVMPDEFIPMGEETGLIKPLSRWVLEAAIRQCGAWRNDGRAVPIAVNLSMRDLHDTQLPDTIEQLLTRWQVAAHLLHVEITESTLMADPDRARTTVARLSALGVRIAIDDFGTGYSSLAYLKKLAVDELKIDRSFVSEMRTDASDRAIVRSTIDLAHNLGLRVVAEGVEDAATWRLLSRLGCDEAQGYYLGRPTPADGDIAWQAQPPRAARRQPTQLAA
jgi:diguanylate cyclase (GGDEF)-like protein